MLSLYLIILLALWKNETQLAMAALGGILSLLQEPPPDGGDLPKRPGSVSPG